MISMKKLLWAVLLLFDELMLAMKTSNARYTSSGLRSFSTESIKRAELSQTPLVILPGFANSHTDYHSDRIKDNSLVHSLKAKGMRNVEVTKIHRSDWLKLLASVRNPRFWKSQCSPYELFGFYLDAVHDQVVDAYRKTGKPAILIGHSAGGWLARSILADGRWRGRGRSFDTSDLVAGLVTLGTPHYPPHFDHPDPSRGALTFVHENFPGAYLRKDGIFYVSVAGNAVRGNPQGSTASIGRLAAHSYLKVTGNFINNGDELGDGLVPVSHAHLDGAKQITLDNVCHGTISTPKLPWYGNSAVVDQWLPSALDSLKIRVDMQSKPGSVVRI